MGRMTLQVVVAMVAMVPAFTVALLVVGVRRRAWADAAEHSKAFWGVWVLGSVAVGLAVPAAAGFGWGAVAWLVACSAFAVLQPSLFADLREVRDYVDRTRRPGRPAPRSLLLAAPGPARIQWRAPAR